MATPYPQTEQQDGEGEEEGRQDQNRKLRRPGFKKWMNNMSNADMRLIAREINSRVGVWII